MWGDEVYVRLSCSNDLVADKGRYHKTCPQRFMTDKKSPDLEDEENRERGRPADEGCYIGSRCCVYGCKSTQMQNLNSKRITLENV